MCYGFLAPIEYSGKEQPVSLVIREIVHHVHIIVFNLIALILYNIWAGH